MSEPVDEQRSALDLQGERTEIHPLVRGMRSVPLRTQAVEPVDRRRDERDVAGTTLAGVEGLDHTEVKVPAGTVQGGEELIVPLRRGHGRVFVGECDARL